MPANTSPIFTLTPQVGHVSIATANTALDGTGAVGTVLTAGSNGTSISEVNVKAAGTTTAGMVRLFLHDGTNYFLFEEIAVTAITPSGTVQAFSADSVKITPQHPLVIPSGYSLRASTHNAETFKVFARAGDY